MTDSRVDKSGDRPEQVGAQLVVAVAGGTGGSVKAGRAGAAGGAGEAGKQGKAVGADSSSVQAISP